MKKIKYFSVAILAMVCGCFTACSEDDVTSGVPVTEITLNEAVTGSELTVKEFETLKVTASVSPADASYKRVLFESSDPGIMTVNQAGVITGVKTGTASLRVFAADGGGASVSYSVFVDYSADITNVRTPGTLYQLLGGNDGAVNAVTSLKLAGTLNDADFGTLTGMANLQTLDMEYVSVTAIPDNAFYNTTALTSVILPAALASVGENAFRACTNLVSVTLNVVTPPETAASAFSEIDRKAVSLTVPKEAYDAYREAEVYGEMTINGIAPEIGVIRSTLDIPAATGVGVWQTVALESPLSTTDKWTMTVVSTQPSTNINDVTFGNADWGVHLLALVRTGTVPAGYYTGNGDPFEFYLGGTSQGGTKVGAIGRGNWNSSTTGLTPPNIALDKPVTITLRSEGDGTIQCTVQNEGVNGGEPIDFKTIPGVETITAVKAAVAVVTYVTIVQEIEAPVRLEIPAAPGLEQWQRVTLETPLSTAEAWTLVAVSTQSHNDVNRIQFGEKGWGVHLFNIEYTGTVNAGFVNGSGKPFEFYLGGTSQGGTKVGAIGRGNWNSSTTGLTPPNIALDKPVTITLRSEGDGTIQCTVQNEGVNGGEPIDFKTIPGVETITAVKAAVAVVTYVTIVQEIEAPVRLEIPAAPGLEQWQRVTLETPLSTAEAWTLVAVSTQSHNDVNRIQFGEKGWGVHLFNIEYTGTVNAGFVNGSGKPFEFYLGGTSQGGTKVGAIGRGNWNSSTTGLNPPNIALDKPVTITLTSVGDGGIACTVQNEGVNGGEPVDFKTITGVETVTEVFAAHPAVTYVTITKGE